MALLLLNSEPEVSVVLPRYVNVAPSRLAAHCLYFQEVAQTGRGLNHERMIIYLFSMKVALCCELEKKIARLLRGGKKTSTR